MTLENCKKLLEHYKKAKDDSSLTAQARLNMKLAELDMMKNIKSKGGQVEETKPKK